MLQLLDLARENAALKCELKRVREEARELRLLLGEDGSAEKAGTSLTACRIRAPSPGEVATNSAIS
jgi:hypothetical protein